MWLKLNASDKELLKKAGIPKQWEKTVKKLKKDPNIDNPFALVNWMAAQDFVPGGKKKK
jgi:hypothetical protein